MNQYGVSTASKAGYAGNADPGAAPEAPIFTAQAFPEGSPEAIKRAKIVKEYQDALTVYQPKKDAYDADKAAYDAYSGSYDQRMLGTPMYAAKQFQTQKQVQPENYDQLFDKYLGADRTDEQIMAGAAAISPYAKIDVGNFDDGIQLTNPQAARNAFIQGIGPTLGTGMGNTGNQAIMEQSGKYYGNVLMNPIYSPSLAIETVDEDGEVIDSGTGGGDTVIDSGTGGGDLTLYSDNGDDSNDNDPFDFPEVTSTGNSFTEDLANLNSWDDASYVNGVLTDNNTGLPVDANEIGEGGTYSGSGNSTWNDPGYNSSDDTESFFSGGGDDGIGEWGAVGDFFGGIGDALGITNYSGDNDDSNDVEDDNGDGGGWGWWQEGGSVKGVTPSGRLIKGYATAGPVEDEMIETITEVPSLDELVNQQIEVQTEGGNNIAELRQMLAASSVPSGQNAGTIRGELGSARQEFMDLVTAQAASAGTGPSESEKWFRLAAAFGKPTQSGHFMENLGLANEAMAGVASERRAAKTDAAGLKLRGAEINIDFLKEDLAAATAAGASEKEYKRNLAQTLMEFEMGQVETAEQREFDLAVIAGEREYEAGKAKTTAAKMADDLGLTGTARNEWIVKYYDEQTELAKLEFEAAANAVSELSTGELNLKIKTEDAMAAADNTISIINEAVSINDLAYAGNIWDSATKAFKGTFNVDDPRYKATERMENLLSSLSLAQLKTTFGGAGITDSERKALDALQGLGSKTPAARLAILERAMAVAKRVGLRSAQRLESITSGTYGRKDTGDK